jgi:WD40 repeat protein
MASASSHGDIVTWDLRKLGKVNSFKLPQSNGDDNMVCQATILSFCPVGKHLAIGTTNGQIFICTTKDMTEFRALKVSANDEGRISGILWGANAFSLITSNDHERGVQFWGIQSTEH